MSKILNREDVSAVVNLTQVNQIKIDALDWLNVQKLRYGYNFKSSGF